MAAQVDVVARVCRGEAVEAVHYGSVAVVDKQGRLTHCLGDPQMVVMARSAIKPFQLMPLIQTGTADHYAFNLRQLAVMCGSHNGTEIHRKVVLSNLQASGHSAADLQCGSHWPLGMSERKQFPRNGEETDPARHNCSGKHSGFLALAKYVGDPSKDYLNPDCKSQQMVKRLLAEYCEYPIADMPVGIDGCSAPNYPLPLINLALGFKKIALHQTAPNINQLVPETIFKAMTTHSEMVSGENRFDYDLARSFPHRLVCKVGAESIEAIGLSDPPLGIVVKIHDGNWRALGAVCVEVLRQLGIIQNGNDYPHLKRHITPEIRRVNFKRCGN